MFKSMHSVFSLSHGVLEGIQFFEVDSFWFAGIKPHNMVTSAFLIMLLLLAWFAGCPYSSCWP